MAIASHYIDGEWVDSGKFDLADSIDPANGTVLGQAALGSSDIASAAIDSARQAFETSKWPTEMRLRSQVLSAFADRLEARQAALTELLVRENGKTRAQANHEIGAGISEARYYAGLARNIFGRTLESGTGKLSLLTREPAGVVAVIVPWNAPVTLLVRSLGPALAAGCTAVIKSAPQTPLINAELIRCFADIEDLPAGVINSVNENGTAVGQTLASHPEVDVVTFTGSSRTGKLVMAQAAPTLKRLSLELGGKSPAIVFADADVDAAVGHICRCSIVMAGQMCTAISRVIVSKAVAAEMIDKLSAAYKAVRLGHGLDQATEMGPLIDTANQQRVLSLISEAEAAGEMILKGAAPQGELSSGAFVTPTLYRIADVTHSLVQQETFAPMVSIEQFDEEGEAIKMANATRFGLSASVYTRDIDRAMRVSRKLRTGTVWLNCHNRLFAEAETGGYRESGMGRLHGVEGLNDFLETKHVYLESEQS